MRTQSQSPRNRTGLGRQGPISLIGYSHYSGECTSVRIDAHSRIRTIHTTATMRSEAHSMSRSEANSRIRLLYPNSRIRFASLRYLALVWKVPKRSALWRRKLSAAETNPLQRLCSMGVGRFVYIDKMFSRRFVDSIINKRNTPTPCRDLSPPTGGCLPPLYYPPLPNTPIGGIQRHTQ